MEVGPCRALHVVRDVGSVFVLLRWRVFERGGSYILWGLRFVARLYSGRIIECVIALPRLAIARRGKSHTLYNVRFAVFLYAGWPA